MLFRAYAMETLPSAPPQHLKKTLHPATQIPKSALMGYVLHHELCAPFYTAPIECFLSLGIDNAIKNINVENLM